MHTKIHTHTYIYIKIYIYIFIYIYMNNYDILKHKYNAV